VHTLYEQQQLLHIPGLPSTSFCAYSVCTAAVATLTQYAQLQPPLIPNMRPGPAASAHYQNMMYWIRQITRHTEGWLDFNLSVCGRGCCTYWVGTSTASVHNWYVHCAVHWCCAYPVCIKVAYAHTYLAPRPIPCIPNKSRSWSLVAPHKKRFNQK